MALLTVCIYEHILPAMSPKEMISLRLDPELLKVMRDLKATEGIPVAVQIEMATRKWLAKRGHSVKTQAKRARTRKAR
jgi:hypothetical protein